MPRLSEKTREKRRQHILTSAWRCFSRDGFHATSIEDVIAATGMSSSAVYRYFRSKEEIIRASAEIGVARVGDRAGLSGQLLRRPATQLEQAARRGAVVNRPPRPAHKPWPV